MSSVGRFHLINGVSHSPRALSAHLLWPALDQEVRESRVAELAKVAHADKIRQTKSTEIIFRLVLIGPCSQERAERRWCPRLNHVVAA